MDGHSLMSQSNLFTQNTSNGKSVVVQVRDECVSCADSNRIGKCAGGASSPFMN